MVKIMENPMNKWDDFRGVKTTIFGGPPIWILMRFAGGCEAPAPAQAEFPVKPKNAMGK